MIGCNFFSLSIGHFIFFFLPFPRAILALKKFLLKDKVLGKDQMNFNLKSLFANIFDIKEKKLNNDVFFTINNKQITNVI